MLEVDKNLLITSDNQKEKVHQINLLKLIPKIKSNKRFEYRQPYIKSRNLKIFDFPKSSKKEKSENEEIKLTNKISQINLNTINKSLNYSTPIIKSNTKKYSKDIHLTNLKTISEYKSPNINKKNLNNDRIYAFFNRNFYENEVQVSKKTELNQKILNYYLKDKEHKEKLQRQKLEELMKKKNRFRAHKLKLRILTDKKNDLKNSLILDDCTLYNKIQRIVRFWGKFTNYSCPIFQVQKFSLESQKYNENKMKFSLDNINQSDPNEKKLSRLPILYTNSTRTINKLSDKKFKLLGKNKSDLNISELNAFKNKAII